MSHDILSYCIVIFRKFLHVIDGLMYESTGHVCTASKVQHVLSPELYQNYAKYIETVKVKELGAIHSIKKTQKVALIPKVATKCFSVSV